MVSDVVASEVGEAAFPTSLEWANAALLVQ